MKYYHGDQIKNGEISVTCSTHCKCYKFSVKKEKTNKMKQSDVYYQFLSQHVSGIILPIFRRSKTVLLHVVYCSGSAGCGW